jgi:ketosteroid isomerase-like protein
VPVLPQVRVIDSAGMATWIPRVALPVLCASLLAGCGGNGSSENDTARSAAEAYVQARNQGDAGKVCELYSDELIQRLGASNCEAFVKEQTAGVATSYTLVGVKESGDNATATIQAAAAGEALGGGQLQITLQRQDGDWKITSLGGAGKSPE